MLGMASDSQREASSEVRWPDETDGLQRITVGWRLLALAARRRHMPAQDKRGDHQAATPPRSDQVSQPTNLPLGATIVADGCHLATKEAVMLQRLLVPEGSARRKRPAQGRLLGTGTPRFSAAYCSIGPTLGSHIDRKSRRCACTGAGWSGKRELVSDHIGSHNWAVGGAPVGRMSAIRPLAGGSATWSR